MPTIAECLACPNADAGLFPDAAGATHCTFKANAECPRDQVHPTITDAWAWAAVLHIVRDNGARFES